MIVIEIPGVPVPHAAPKFTRSGHAYSIRNENKDFAQWHIKSQYKEALICGPVSINATFYMPIPKATSRVRRLQMIEDKIHHLKRPDLSNLFYFLENCLKGTVIEDDSQVSFIIARKMYAENPRSVLIINKIN